MNTLTTFPSPTLRAAFTGPTPACLPTLTRSAPLPQSRTADEGVGRYARPSLRICLRSLNSSLNARRITRMFAPDCSPAVRG